MSNLPENEDKLTVGITIGDINGIGPEVIIKTFTDNRMHQVCTPVIYGSTKAISFHKKALNNTEFNFTTIKNCLLNESTGTGATKHGIYLLRASNSTIQNNTIKIIDSATYAIILSTSSKNNTIIENNLTTYNTGNVI